MTGPLSTLDRSAALPQPPPQPPVHRRIPSRPVLVAGGTGVTLGIGAAGGSVVRGSGTNASALEALPYALIGAATAAAVVGALYGVVVSVSPRHQPLARRLLLLAMLVAAAIGGLLGAGATPDSLRSLEPEPADPAEPIQPQPGSVLPDGTVAGPVDRDGDGIADRDPDGNPVLGGDFDGDGVYDTVFVACDASPGAGGDGGGGDPVVDGEIIFDAGCDGDIDQQIPYDDALLVGDQLVLPPPVESPSTSRRPSSGIDDFLIVAISIVAGIVAAAGLIALIVARRRRVAQAASPGLSDDPTVGDPPADEHGAIADTLRDSIDALDDPDPRRAICVAYGRLLDGLAQHGVARRPEEAPEEHLRRCLAATDIRPEPLRDLLGLFALARFSVRPITEQHRSAALAALHTALADLGVDHVGARS